MVVMDVMAVMGKKVSVCHPGFGLSTSSARFLHGASVGVAPFGGRSVSLEAVGRTEECC